MHTTKRIFRTSHTLRLCCAFLHALDLYFVNIYVLCVYSYMYYNVVAMIKVPVITASTLFIWWSNKSLNRLTMQLLPM
uniref:Uncharacterized protein n=1 Tax=Lutzomyia longipalpis TaxID=7200 RepID=A0A7G3B206_LUTLO